MIIRHSESILKQLSELETRIQKFERLMEELGIDCDRENILQVIIAGNGANAPRPANRKKLE